MTSSAHRALVEIGDLTVGEARRILDRATALESGGRSGDAWRPRFSLALLFLTPSLRTRLGFAEAAIRLGGVPIDLHSPRWTPDMEEAETFADTLRTATGMVDLVAVRTPFALRQDDFCGVLQAPLVNGGDAAHHPVQALVDAFAIERLRGPISDQVIAICGDLSMRAVRSFLDLLVRIPPRALVLIAAPGREPQSLQPSRDLAARTSFRHSGDLDGISVLIMCGLPQGTGERLLDRKTRQAFAVTPATLVTLPPKAIVLSPLPIIDEISPEARADPRIRMFDQSDLSVFVRMAVIESLLEPSPIQDPD